MLTKKSYSFRLCLMYDGIDSARDNFFIKKHARLLNEISLNNIL